MTKFHLHKPLGLQSKAVLVMAVIVVSTMAFGGWTYHHLLGIWMRQSLLSETEHLAEVFRLTVAEPLARGDRKAVASLAVQFFGQNRVLQVRVLDATGKSLVDLDRRTTTDQHTPTAEQAVELSEITVVQANAVSAQRPVLADNNGNPTVVGAVRLVLDGSETQERLNRADAVILSLGGLLILCGMPLGHLLVRYTLVAPIRRLARAAGRLAAGDLSARAQTGGSDEIAKLADGFNTMADQIQQQHHQLQAANEHLESCVQQRTAELSQANEQLRAELAEREEFLRAVGHDLNAPLRNIDGIAKMLLAKSREQLPEKVVQRLERIQANVRTETELINELLELSRIRIRPHRRKPVDVAELLRQVAQQLEFDRHEAAVELVLDDNMPTLLLERSRMRQVFINLLDNAIKYMGAGKQRTVTVGYRRENDEHVFYVRDTGMGIDPKDHKRIFTVFNRTADSRNIPGRGIGLSIVKTIVTKEGGRVWLESQPGAGSTFYVALPVERAILDEPTAFRPLASSTVNG